MSKPVYSDDRVHLMPEKCSTCIFRPDNLMSLQPGRVKDMVDGCLEHPAGNIPCHQTIHGQRDQQAICRGFWDSYKDRQSVLVLAEQMGKVVEVSGNVGGDQP
jgi:hypothetical protein